MKKMIVAFLAAACAFAGFGAATEDTHVANHKWVREQFAKAGISISTSTIWRTGEVVTITAPFTSTNYPTMRKISFTVTQPTNVVRVVTNRVSAVSRLLSLFVPTAFAQGTDEAENLTMTVKSGYWEDASGQKHAFNFGDGLDLTNQNGDCYPELPESTHNCDINTDCNCKDSLKSESTIESEAKTQYPKFTQTDFFSEYGSWESWISKNDTNVKTRTIGGKTVYSIQDCDGQYFNLDIIQQTDAWLDAVLLIFKAVNERIEDCQDNYIDAHTCNATNPQHNWQTYTCGANTWKICQRNNTHTQGTEAHEMKSTPESYTAQKHIFKCKCGSQTVDEAHSPVIGTKTYTRDTQQHITGWTAPITCTCGWSSSKTHTCLHNYCHACEGGDDCNLACQYCNGSHNYSTAGENGCSVCQCPGCGCIRSLTTNGGSPVQITEYHGGWHACANENHVETGNERGNGKHCLCDCGYNACSVTPGEWSSTYGLYTGGRCAESTHNRTDLETPTYAQITDDDAQHWAQTKSDCTRCGDKYGVKENHTWGDEETPVYKYLNNEKCALRKKCEKCEYKIYQDASSAGAHTPNGSATQHTKISDSVCRSWYTCSKCEKSYYEDGEHVRDTNNGCKCQKCKDYQFAHQYNQTDECGNKCCACGNIDPNANEQHINYTDKGDGNHVCACGKNVKAHVWGAWVKTGTANEMDNYTATCTVCPATKTKSVPVNTPPESCTASNHIPLSDKCGCQCGMYTPGEPYTNANNQVATGSASDEDRFHAWGVTDGVTNCICKCGTKHSFREWPSDAKEALTSYPASFCPVCYVCKVRDRSGNTVQESDHVARDQYGAHAGCGCKCGKYGSDATLVALHPKHPNTCRCYGQSGNGDGIWHYPNARTDCTHICAYAPNGVKHKANTGNAAVAEESVQATWEDHTRKDTDCGCKCGTYTHESVTAAMETLHYMAYNKCICECEKTTIEHDPKRGPGATATKKDATLHTLTNACKRCGLPCYADESSHGFEYHSIEKVPANASTHWRIKDCTHGVQALAGCGYSVTNSAPHLYSTNWYFQDQTWHIVSNICNVATDALNPPCGYRKSSREQHTNYDHGWIMMNATHCYPDVWCRKCNSHVKYDVARASAHDFSTSTEDWHTCIRCGYTGAHTWGEPSAIGSYGNHQKCTICNRVKILPNE